MMLRSTATLPPVALVILTAVSLLILHVSEPPPRILEVCPELPELARVQTLLDRLLAKDAADRPQSQVDGVTASPHVFATGLRALVRIR